MGNLEVSKNNKKMFYGLAMLFLFTILSCVSLVVVRKNTVNLLVKEYKKIDDYENFIKIDGKWLNNLLMKYLKEV